MIRKNRWLHPTVLLLASTHFLVDGYSNIYAPLLPLLIPRLGMNLTTAGILAMVFQIAASVSQLGWGHLADRWRPRLLLLGGPILAVTVLSCAGMASSTWALGLILGIGGLGGAMFHPPAAAIVHRLGSVRRGLAMSVHITAGTLGFSLGPLLFAPFADRFGLSWTPVLALPGLAILAVILSRIPKAPDVTGARSAEGWQRLRPYAKQLILLYAVVVLRTLASLSFATFVPVMLTRRGWSLAAAGSAAAAYQFASGIGGFFGGPLADRYGARNVIVLSLLAAVPFLFVAPSLDGAAFVILVSVGGLCLQSTLPVNVTFAQSITGTSTATVSSIMMGFGWGTGGLSVPLVGWLADRIGISQTLTWLSIMPLLAAACAWPLPKRLRRVDAQPVDVGVPGQA